MSKRFRPLSVPGSVTDLADEIGEINRLAAAAYLELRDGTATSGVSALRKIEFLSRDASVRAANYLAIYGDNL